ncbi:toxin-antitoxin system YwqK family antitoxin [uncultured Fusobacterium sp.]|uniref:toxin-antitoxin system YwqK family antitoxin n=1 Tax=uncultured Fusobacterium sp. TaxID=159267 RepID=UPI0025E98F56|nr:toxin-antitoxin system YwqK family antitoxin [uncultured Fusobacterium sp.]
MKAKAILGVVLLVGIVVGTYIYQNRYLFFKYLPAIEKEEQLKNINGKLCDEDGKLFTGRTKSASEEYTDIYSYKDGELDGLNVVYYKNNIKEIGHWKAGKQNGLFQMYTEDGVLIDNANFKAGERDGLTEQFYNDTGKLRVSANYKNGVLEGEFKAYYPNGNLQGEVNYVNGEMNGDFKEYHENKKIRLSGSYKNSLQEGEWKFYLEDGTLESIINYKDGELHGIKEDYYKNGNVWTRQEFKNNDLDGVYEVYYENGNLQLKAKIKNGQTIEEQRFNHDETLYNEQDEKIVESNDEIIISEELEKGMKTLGKEVGNSLNSMVEATIITNLAYVDLMSFENVEILEENLIFNDNEKIPFKRSYKNGVHRVNVPFENNSYLWVELKENSEGKHRLFAENYEKFKEIKGDKKINLEEIIFPTIDDYYRENNVLQKFFDITISVKNHS